MRCLAKQREDRFQNFEELQAALLARPGGRQRRARGARRCPELPRLRLSHHPQPPHLPDLRQQLRRSAPRRADAAPAETCGSRQHRARRGSSRRWRPCGAAADGAAVAREGRPAAGSECAPAGHGDRAGPRRGPAGARRADARTGAPQAPGPTQPTTGRCSGGTSPAPATRPRCSRRRCSGAGSTRSGTGSWPPRRSPTAWCTWAGTRTGRRSRAISWRCSRPRRTGLGPGHAERDPAQPVRDGRQPALCGLTQLADGTGPPHWPQRLGLHRRVADHRQPRGMAELVYFGTENGTFYALHAQSGQRIWTFARRDGHLFLRR